MLTRAIAAVAVTTLSSCASYSYVARGPGPDYAQLPADNQNPRTQRVWSYAWGNLTFPWSPLDCGPAVAKADCQQPRDPCDGNGVAQFTAKLPWYAVPVAVVTLGLAMPVDLTVWCSTLKPPSTGP